MSEYYLFQDVKKCIGCQACEIQCKTTKNLPASTRPCQVIQVGPKFIGGLPRMSFVFMPCFHCETAWCVSACPTGAMQKRKSDGIVFIDSELCVGCKACISACPWGAPQWRPDTGKVEKCDYCKDRIDEGKQPACVTTCTTGCLVFGKARELPQTRRLRHAKSTAAIDQSTF